MDDPGGPDVTKMVHVRKDAGEFRVRAEGEMMTEAEIGIMYFEDGERKHKPRNTGDSKMNM